MRVLLINPGSPRALKKENLGLAFLAAALSADNHDVRIADENAGHCVEKVVDGFQPDVIGISFMTMFAPRAYALAEVLRHRRPVPLVAGGAHPTALPEEALQHFDCVIRGEGELSLPRVLRNGTLSGIVEPHPPEDLDALPMPRRDLLEMEFYANQKEQLAGLSYRTLGIITSRGCPHRCVFCANSTRTMAVRYHSPERVLTEMAELVKRYHIESIAFYDEQIAADPFRFRQICEGMVERKLNYLKWECQIHPRSAQPELLKIMKRAGCVQVAIGFESGSQKILDAINKNMLVEENLQAARQVHEAGLRLRGCFIIGTPGETREDIAATQRFMETAAVDFASLHFLTPLPGSLLYEKYSERINQAATPWDRFTAGDPNTFICNEAMSPEEQKETFRSLSAQLAFRNYTWKEKLRRAYRNPRHALRILYDRWVHTKTK